MHLLELAPSSISFGAAINSLESAGQWQFGLQLLSQMLSTMIPDPTTYSALMGTVEASSQWQKALQLFADMPSMKLKLDVLALNLALRASVTGWQWQEAFGLVADMARMQVTPNPTTFSLAVAAAEHGCQWSAGLSLLNRLAHQREWQEFFACQMGGQKHAIPKPKLIQNPKPL